MCRAHATVRGLLGELVTRSGSDRDVVVDMEAGLEHLSRGTGRHVDRFVAVLEPYYRSMETARRVAALAHELGISDVVAVANKVRNDEDRQAITDYCASHALALVGEVPYDPVLLEAERHGTPPLDYAPDAPAVSAIRALAGKLALAALLLLPGPLSPQTPLRQVGHPDVGGDGFSGTVAVVSRTAMGGANMIPAAGVRPEIYNPLPCPADAVNAEDLRRPEVPRARPPSDEQRAHRMERAVKGIKNEAEDLQRHDTEQRLGIARLPEDDRCVSLALGQGDVALGDRPADGGAVGQGEVHLPFGGEADGPPHRFREQGVDRPAVYQEPDRLLPGGPLHHALDVAQAHVPEAEMPRAGRVIERSPGVVN